MKLKKFALLLWSIIDAFSIFDPHTLPCDDEELAGHG